MLQQQLEEKKCSQSRERRKREGATEGAGRKELQGGMVKSESCAASGSERCLHASCDAMKRAGAGGTVSPRNCGPNAKAKGKRQKEETARRIELGSFVKREHRPLGRTL